MKANIKTRRIYEEPLATDGYRVLVDRLWPRGISKEAAQLDEWAKDIAPSTALRKWFAHSENRFDEFANRYRLELSDRGEELQRLRDIAERRPLCLLYAARDTKCNHALVLMSVLLKLSED